MEKVVEELQSLNAKVDTIIGLLGKPGNKTARVFELVATGIGILGILSIIDIIKNWIMGG
jgi:hypothetical protein